MKEQAKIYRDNLSKERPIFLKQVIGALVPFVMVYGIYILFNGALSPGGGFSGGAILGVSLVLASVAYGPKAVRKFFPYKTLSIFRVVAFSAYVILLAYAFIMYNQDLYTIFRPGNPESLFGAGMILPLNLSVGIIKTCTIYALYALFADGEV
ncbi:MAG: MnhB domain-containing protein [Clostridiales bacterium]|jgi:multicomponent Na+:H+ antiporter subunit B|nr:MnhB domain-containing protein [Clostridiales bacterium]